MTEKAKPLGRILLKNVRVAFAQGLFEAKAMANDPKSKPRFGAQFLLAPDHPQMAELEKVIAAVAADKWKDKAPAMVAAIKKKDATFLHDGDDKPSYDGFPGNFYVSANADQNSQPTLFNADTTKWTPGSSDKRIYSGCYVNANIDIYAQDNAFGKRINASLRGVQFFRDGDAFSAGRPADSDEFEDVSAGTDAEDFA